MNIASPLIDVATLAAAIVPPAVPGAARATAVPTVLDVRWRLGGPPGRNEYRAGHIPGAAFIDLDAEVSGPPGAGGRHPLPDPGTLQAALRAAGVSASRPVIVYDAGDGLPAARLWWTLRWAGHPRRPGARRRFRRLGAGRTGDRDRNRHRDDTAGDRRLHRRTGASSGPGRRRRRRRTDGAVRSSTPARRSASAGEIEPIDPIAGHIPGAGNLPSTDLIHADGTFRSAAGIRERMARAGIDESSDFGAYCGSGVTAAHTVLAAAVAGLPTPALYVGSWSEWITDPTRPIATGADPGRPMAGTTPSRGSGHDQRNARPLGRRAARLRPR